MTAEQIAAEAAAKKAAEEAAAKAAAEAAAKKPAADPYIEERAAPTEYRYGGKAVGPFPKGYAGN